LGWIFIGGGAWFSGAVYSTKSGNFVQTDQPAFELGKMSEDTHPYFDANGDGVLDLYVVSGSYEMDSR